MTTEKLTARLSDGTEWEVLSTAGPTCGMRSGVPYRDETIRVELKPKKPSPPKEVWINLYPDGQFAATHRSKYSAMTNCENTGAVTLRYILAPEPESKPSGVIENTCKQCGRKFDYLCVTEGYERDLCGGCLLGVKKPAREWWVVVKKVTGVPHTTRNSEADAVSFVESFSVVEARQYEVVHVREVVSE